MRKLRNFYGLPRQIDDKTYSIDVMSGANIMDTIAEAISAAYSFNATMQFKFNGVIISVRSDSNPELIRRDWSRALNGYIDDQKVGPYPNPIFTDEEKESDARIKAENERKRQERQAEYEAKARAKREATDAKLAEAPEMDLADENAWQEFKDKNQDPYGAGVVVYAERWARLMQREMANGKKLEDVAEDTSHEADNEGITGFMYGCAVSILSQVWVHGDELRRWHNLKTQIGNEGEKANEYGVVLNPALLSIRIR